MTKYTFRLYLKLGTQQCFVSVCVCAYICVCMYIYMYMCAYVCVCISVYIYICVLWFFLCLCFFSVNTVVLRPLSLKKIYISSRYSETMAPFTAQQTYSEQWFCSILLHEDIHDFDCTWTQETLHERS